MLFYNNFYLKANVKICQFKQKMEPCNLYGPLAWKVFEYSYSQV